MKLGAGLFLQIEQHKRTNTPKQEMMMVTVCKVCTHLA